MHFYRQSIILFGMIIPVIAASVIIGICYFFKAKMTASYEFKQANFKSHEQGRLASIQIEGEVTNERKHFDRWNEQLSQETASTVATNLKEIIDSLPGKEIQQTAFERPAGAGGMGMVSAQNSSQIRIAFRGTFRSLQRAFLELETRMPHLQLEELRMDPSSNQSSSLNVQVTFSAWEK